MALKPVLKRKVDELFLRWLSEPDTQALLKINLKQIQKGEAIIHYTQSHISGANIAASKAAKVQSPRVRPGSPSTPPCSPALASPRSPRRLAFSSKGNRKSQKHQLEVSNNQTPLPHHDKVPLATDTSASISKRGEPDGEPDTFLRQKEAQLRERREKEKKDKDTVSNVPSHKITKVGTAHGTATQNGGVTGAPQQSHKDSKSEHRLRHSVSESTSLGRHKLSIQTHSTKSDSQLLKNNVNIPPFFFPHGRPGGNGSAGLETSLQQIKDAFGKVEGGKADKLAMASITKAAGLPLYWKGPLFLYCGGEKQDHVTLQQVLVGWKKLCNSCHDDASRFLRLLAKPGLHYIEDEDFIQIVTDVVESHPGLTFLQDAPEFHSRYIQTVISRIFYCVNRSWTGRITLAELRRSNLLHTIKLLEEEEDINQITDFFSYEHFYVIYCKFWELDKNHDLFISKEDMARHNDHAISSKMIERIFSGAVTRNLKDGEYMSYKDFVWFLISEEDKRHPTSVEYWFRCMDLDGDGVISMYEMEYFYNAQVEKMEQLGIETLPFEDTLCQMLDMLKPRNPENVKLRDLKSCKLSPIFFDTFFNLDKYLEHEQKDPFANQRDIDSDEPEASDWEKYAAEEYELLVAEEGANEGLQEELVYEDDFEAEDDVTGQTTPINAFDKISLDGPGNQSKSTKQTRPKAPSPEEDIYDFTTKDLGY